LICRAHEKKEKEGKKKIVVSSLKKENSSWTIELPANLGQFVSA
jgi:hypothetical protein